MSKGKIKDKFVTWANKYELTREMINNYGVRTVVFAILSFAISIAYGAYNFTLAILGTSIWYGVLAAYYILLACMRGGVITHHRRRFRAHRRGTHIENVKIKGIKRYRNCGIMLIIMTIALSIAVLQMISAHNTFEHAGFMIYAAAAYTFYKVTMSIINIVKAKKQNDITIQAIRNINLADATVSLLALQTSMIHAFGADDGIEFADTLNGVTGAAVCALVFALGIYMIVNAKRRLEIERNKVSAPDEDDSIDEGQEERVEGE